MPRPTRVFRIFCVCTLTTLCITETKQTAAQANSTESPSVELASKKQNSTTSRFTRIFSATTAPSWKLATYFVARSPSALRGMSFARKDASVRAESLQQLESDYKLVQRASPQALRLGQTILNLATQQSLYLEYLKGLGLADPGYPDTLHSVKVFRSKTIYFADQLLEQFPKDHNAKEWQAESLVSRLRIADTSVTKAALTFAKSGNGVEQTRVRLTGIALDFGRGRQKSAYGSLETGIAQAPDRETKAAFTLLAAELVNSKKAPARAIELYEQAGRTGTGIRLPNGEPGLFLKRAAVRIAEIAYSRNASQVDTEILNTLKAFGMPDIMRHYVERVALSVYAKQPHQAMQNYENIKSFGGLDANITRLIELRILDIALLGRDPELVEKQWERLKTISGGLDLPGLDDRVVETQSLTWSVIAKTTNAPNVDRFVRLHDWFITTSFSRYKSDDNWSLRVLDALFKIQRDTEVARRADAVAGSSSKSSTKLAALRYAARARERILHIESKPNFAKNQNLANNKSVALAYIGTLDSSRDLTKGQERLDCIFNAALVTFQIGDIEGSRKRFEVAIAAEFKSKYAAQSVSFLLDHSMSRQDHPYTESIARLAENKKVVPADPKHQNLRKIIEDAVYAHAEFLMKTKQYEPSAEKFIAFAKEFPKADRAPTSLDFAAKNYLTAGKVELAIVQMEDLLKRFPTSKYAFATRWAAAEHSKSIGQFLRASKHYEAFAKTYPKEGLTNKAWIKAAEMHRATGRLSDAAATYEKHLALTPAKAEKLAMAREIAELHAKHGKPGDALGAYDRVTKLAQSGDDVIWATEGRATVFMAASDDAKARTELIKLIGLSPGSKTGTQLIARGKFMLGRMDAHALSSNDLMQEKDLEKGMRKTITEYARIKTLLLAPCEVPGVEWCSVGYLEASQLAEQLAKAFLEVEAPPSLNPTAAKAVQGLSISQGRKFSQETLTYSEQAERALSSGAPDAEWANRIREWASEHKGYRDDYLLNANPQ